MKPKLTLVSIWCQGGREWSFVKLKPSYVNGKEVYKVPESFQHKLALRRATKLGMKLPGIYTVSVGC